MAKTKSSFVCQSCGAAYSRWQGRCEACSEWNSIVEELADSGVGAGPKSAMAGGRPIELVPLSGETESAARIVTGMAELDRVTGGGFVMGSAVLVGGDPGIGKSTLLLQAAAALAEQGKRVVYVSPLFNSYFKQCIIPLWDGSKGYHLSTYKLLLLARFLSVP